MTELLEKVKKEALDNVSKYSQVTSVAFRPATMDQAASLEIAAKGESFSTLKVLSDLKRFRKYDDGNERLVPIAQIGSLTAERFISDDVAKLDVDSGEAKNSEFYRLLADAEYGAISPEIAIRRGSFVADWIDTMFDAPLDFKAYVSGFLNANAYSDFSRSQIQFYIADFTKVNIVVVRNGKRFSLRKNNEKVTNVFGGQDGSALFAGPDSKTIQFRLASFHGATVSSSNQSSTPKGKNLFGKGLLAKSHLSSVEEGCLVFDKTKPSKNNIVVLDINSVKGLWATEIKKLVSGSSTVFRIIPQGRDEEDKVVFTEITKISKTSKTSATYQWASVCHPDGLLMDLVTRLMPKDVVQSELSPSQENIMGLIGSVATDLNSTVLTGRANKNQVLSFMCSYLPKMRTRKCIMVGIAKGPQGKKVEQFTVTAEDGSVEVFEVLNQGQILDIMDRKKFVVGRNPMLTPAGICVLENNKGSYFGEIYDIEEDVVSVFTDIDCKNLQADDDGDDNACDPNELLVSIMERHALWVKRSIFALGVNIENDKKGRIVEKNWTIDRIVSTLEHSTYHEKFVRDEQKRVAIDFINNYICGVEQPVVGLSSDTSVNILSQIKWVKWSGEENNVVKQANTLLREYKEDENGNLVKGKGLYNKLLGVAGSTFKNNEKPYVWVPADLCSLRLLLLYYVSVWFCQTAIDWKKRAYRVISVLFLADSQNCGLRDYAKLSPNEVLVKKMEEARGCLVHKMEEARWTSSESEQKPDDAKEILINNLVKKNQNQILICDLLGGLIGSQVAVTNENIKAVTGLDINCFLQPEDQLFWNVKWVNMMFSALTRAFGANPDRSWKSLAKNAFACTDEGDSTVAFMISEAEDVYGNLARNVNDQCLLGMMLRKTISANKIPNLVKAYNSITELNKGWQYWLNNQTDLYKEWVKHLTMSMTHVYNNTNVENVLEVNVNVKAFQNFLRINNLEFNNELILGLCGINGTRRDQQADKQSMIQTMLEYAELIDDREKKELMDIEDFIMNVLDDVAFQSYAKVSYDQWVKLGKKAELTVAEFQTKNKNMSYSTWFMAGWKNGVFKRCNDLNADLKSFISDFRKEFESKLWKTLEGNESLNRMLEWANNEKTSHSNQMVDVIISNISRTLRTLDYWYVSKDFKSIRTNSENWRKRKGLEIGGAKFDRFKSSTNSYQLVEKLILQKGWTPADINFHFTLMRPVIEKRLTFVTKDNQYGSYFSWKEIKSWTLTGTADKMTMHQLATGVCGTFYN